MDKVLKPEHLDVEPGTVNVNAEYQYWNKTFIYYLSALTAAEMQHDKFQVLTKLISFKVFSERNFDFGIQGDTSINKCHCWKCVLQ